MLNSINWLWMPKSLTKYYFVQVIRIPYFLVLRLFIYEKVNRWCQVEVKSSYLKLESCLTYSYLEYLKDGHHASDGAPTLSLILFFALKKFNTWIFIDAYNLIYVHNGWESKKKQLRVDDIAQTKKTGI